MMYHHFEQLLFDMAAVGHRTEEQMLNGSTYSFFTYHHMLKERMTGRATTDTGNDE